MRIVFEKFEKPLRIAPGEMSVLRIADPLLFSRCAHSLIQEYAADVLEPAAIFDDDNRELKVSGTLFIIGDILSFDLNDKKILTLAVKKLISHIVEEGDSRDTLRKMNLQIEEVFEDQILQMNGDYAFLQDWDENKYLKMAGFAIDATDDVTPFDKVRHLLRVASDLFPERVLAFINLCTFLTQAQFDELREQVAAEQLMVMLCETDARIDLSNLDNRLLVDEDYLEY